MEKYNKLLRNITELVKKGLFTSKDLKKEVEDSLKFKKQTKNLQRQRNPNSQST